ncbi:uncharacterized protein B0I36DRAFT_333479 [Microdochium trichocladiopsis]|uniref:Uncharacterized protein n=1 Tax=Microdochium trichocladiopsis TaxID=1682393 RepID=A0A9P8XX23_9PEZI|nr:uncharacterized protein B0I36DRAFT_333479 [Microdochium trichocladiopsis]KAH7020942.1 hypothetical protein B0I36DRAFT_333479 [Microdochium trichocladiopsis]
MTSLPSWLWRLPWGQAVSHVKGTEIALGAKWSGTRCHFRCCSCCVFRSCSWSVPLRIDCAGPHVHDTAFVSNLGAWSLPVTRLTSFFVFTGILRQALECAVPGLLHPWPTRSLVGQARYVTAIHMNSTCPRIRLRPATLTRASNFSHGGAPLLTFIPMRTPQPGPIFGSPVASEDVGVC